MCRFSAAGTGRLQTGTLGNGGRTTEGVRRTSDCAGCNGGDTTKWESTRGAGAEILGPGRFAESTRCPRIRECRPRDQLPPRQRGNLAPPGFWRWSWTVGRARIYRNRRCSSAWSASGSTDGCRAGDFRTPGVVSHGGQRRFHPIVPSVPGCCIFHGNEGVQRPRESQIGRTHL